MITICFYDGEQKYIFIPDGRKNTSHAIVSLLCARTRGDHCTPVTKWIHQNMIFIHQTRIPRKLDTPQSWQRRKKMYTIYIRTKFLWMWRPTTTTAKQLKKFDKLFSTCLFGYTAPYTQSFYKWYNITHSDTGARARARNSPSPLMCAYAAFCFYMPRWTTTTQEKGIFRYARI